MITAKGNAGVTVEIGPIDVSLLRKQNKLLVEMIWDDMDTILWGVVEMLNDVIDEAERDLHTM